MGKERAYSAKPSITSGDRCQASLPGLDLLFGMGAGGGPWRPQTTGLMPVALGQTLLARDLARWLVWRSGAVSPRRPKSAGMRPVACGPHGPPFPMLKSRSSPGSDARHQSPDVILGFAEYALSFPIYLPVFLSLCSLDNHFCTIVNSISLFVLD